MFGDPLEAPWKRCVFGLCGADAGTRSEQSGEWIRDVRQAISEAI